MKKLCLLLFLCPYIAIAQPQALKGTVLTTAGTHDLSPSPRPPLELTTCFPFTIIVTQGEAWHGGMRGAIRSALTFWFFCVKTKELKLPAAGQQNHHL